MKLSSFPMLLQQQIALLEELNTAYTEAQQLGQQGLQKVGMLSKDLRALQYRSRIQQRATKKGASL
jgi:uncharacterized coiled-coil protein SlyX